VTILLEALAFGIALAAAWLAWVALVARANVALAGLIGDWA
jgi:hypothetical protein